MQYFASCPKYIEPLLAEELNGFGAESTKLTVAGVLFSAEPEVAYRACLWSRLANKIILLLDSPKVSTAEDLYHGVCGIDWSEHFLVDNTFIVNFSGQTSEIRHTKFGALKTKDAINDQFREKYGDCPKVDKVNPQILIEVRLQKGKAQIGINLSGESLHKRGYRLKGGEAPLKENLAAAILIRSNWPELAKQNASLIDPLCGSGTLLIEAALMALDIAPGLLGREFGFLHWQQHIPALWQRLLQEAEQRRLQTVDKKLFIQGYDADYRVVNIAKENIAHANLTASIQIACKELNELNFPGYFPPQQKGLLVCNPPYGERLNDHASLIHLYRCLSEQVKEAFPAWTLAMITANPELAKSMTLCPDKQYAFYNGPLASKLFIFHIHAVRSVDKERNMDTDNGQMLRGETAQSPDRQSSDDPPLSPLSSGQQMFANRLNKNMKGLKKWLKENRRDCYRIYDADMPEYAVAVDRYGDYLHVQEYAPPASVDEQKAMVRLNDILLVLPLVINIKPDNILLKQRRRQKGKKQYEKVANGRHFFSIKEGDVSLLVNLTDYLDTGLFLDHCLMRLWFAEHCRGKKFLNLFCYTAAATVHAAIGKAFNTTSVDMSSTYLDWARKNLALNGLSEHNNQLIQADCVSWLEQCRDKYDVIFLDPPTFSNSKRMRQELDIQRDHCRLIDNAMNCLHRNGQLFFSTNFQKFRMDETLQERYCVNNITARTIDKDFSRRAKIHQCWEIKHC